MKKTILYIIIFLAIQVSIALLLNLVLSMWFPAVKEDSAVALVYASAITNALIILLFLGFKWCPMSRNYIRTRPWQVFIWTALLAIGIIVPLAFLEEQIPESWRTDLMGEELVKMLKTSEGYFVVCMLAPLAEEVVFRGAIIRALQAYFKDHNFHFSILGFQFGGSFAAVIISALIFAGIHFNPAQMPHAFIVGCLLGWLFVRTNSIVPGFILHWINNSTAYVAVMMFPNMPLDAPLVQYFGSTAAVVQAIVCSLMIALPSLYQLNRVLRKDDMVRKGGMLILMMLFVTNGVSAEDKVMPYTENEGHYFVEITVAGTKMQAMLETGAGAFSMTEDFYEAHKDELGLEVKPVKKGVISELGSQKGYEVLYRGRGSFMVGEVLYRGPVIVTDKARTYQLLPVQCLRHPTDTSSIMIVNPVKQNITFKEKDFRYELAEGKWEAYPLHFEKNNIRPLLTTVARVELNHHEYVIRGDYIVDMGNPNHLTLSENNEQVAAMMEAEEDAVKKSRDDKGRVRGFVLKSERLKLMDNTFRNVPISIKAKYISPNAKWAGLIGLRAFRSQYAFDWQRKTMYIKK